MAFLPSPMVARNACGSNSRPFFEPRRTCAEFCAAADIRRIGFRREMLVEPLDSRSRDISASSNPAFEHIVTAYPSDSKLGHSELCNLRFLHLQVVGMWHVGAIPPNAHRG
jgi:hypothetical protein